MCTFLRRFVMDERGSHTTEMALAIADAGADVVLDSFAPGTLQGWDLGRDRLVRRSQILVFKDQSHRSSFLTLRGNSRSFGSHSRPISTLESQSQTLVQACRNIGITAQAYYRLRISWTPAQSNHGLLSYFFSHTCESSSSSA